MTSRTRIGLAVLAGLAASAVPWSALAQTRPVTGVCLQPRFTENAPPEFYNLKNAIEQPTEADYAAARATFPSG